MISDLRNEQPNPAGRFASWKVALALSVLPGGGHVYLGYTRRGLVRLTSIAALMTLLAANVVGRIEPFFVLLLMFAILHNFLDAYRLAILARDAAAADLLPPPEAAWQLSRSGRVLLGLLLMVGGTLALLVVRFGFDLRWLLEYWPVTFIALGLWLLVQALRERR